MEEKRPEAYRLTFILSPPSAETCLSLAKRQGISDILILRGKGTVRNCTLRFLGIKRQEKVILNMVLDAQDAHAFFIAATEALALDKPNHGIAFLTPILRNCHIEECSEEKSGGSDADNLAGQEEEYAQVAKKTVASHTNESAVMQGIPYKEEGMQYKKLTIIVNLGMAEEIMAIARNAGAKGGTILHGRGTGAQVSEKLFGMEIEPEKELLLILAPEDVANSVILALEEELSLDRPGTGILYVESVSEVRGLVLE